MARLVDVEEVKHIVNNYIDRTGADTFTREHIFDFLFECTAIEAEPVNRGEWIERKCEWFLYKCNLCDCGSDMETDYCPNCGARMDDN